MMGQEDFGYSEDETYLDYARQLLAEAGYPNGRDARTGEPLKLFIDVQSQAISNTTMNWMDRAFGEISYEDLTIVGSEWTSAVMDDVWL